jgi:hypothetical protein
VTNKQQQTTTTEMAAATAEASGKGKKGPKQRQMRHLGPKYVFFCFFFFHFIDNKGP